VPHPRAGPATPASQARTAASFSFSPATATTGQGRVRSLDHLHRDAGGCDLRRHRPYVERGVCELADNLGRGLASRSATHGAGGHPEPGVGIARRRNESRTWPQDPLELLVWPTWAHDRGKQAGNRPMPLTYVLREGPLWPGALRPRAGRGLIEGDFLDRGNSAPNKLRNYHDHGLGRCHRDNPDRTGTR
jgi:hypothetical protein